MILINEHKNLLSGIKGCSEDGICPLSYFRRQAYFYDVSRNCNPEKICPRESKTVQCPPSVCPNWTKGNGGSAILHSNVLLLSFVYAVVALVFFKK